MKSEKQKTIKKPITVSGTGLHTGQNANLTFKPAPENYGHKIKRIDIEGHPTIDIDVDLVIDTSRGTTLEKNGVRIYTIEHVMAALAGLRIDNILIEMDQVEVPIMDGSSHFFTQALCEAGVQEQNAEREFIYITEEIVFEDPKKTRLRLRSHPARSSNLK
jgi:UDP-3-O-[3-hydroxymyristoyl] N-acetylglucosamine deacetylase / 3-hydroxyacyl-[acyl-carrier-protein] dehydratase